MGYFLWVQTDLCSATFSVVLYAIQRHLTDDFICFKHLLPVLSCILVSVIDIPSNFELDWPWPSISFFFTRDQFWPPGIFIVCVCVCVWVCFTVSTVFEIARWTEARDWQKQRQSSKATVYAGPKVHQSILVFGNSHSVSKFQTV